MREIKTTKEVEVPKRLIDQIIGQDKAVEIIKKAASQKRNVLLIGPPGTGKSMLAQAMSELLPVEYLEDVLVYPNPNNDNSPMVKSAKTYPDAEYLLKNPEYAKLYAPKEIMEMKKKTGNELADFLKTGLGRRLMNYKKMMDDQQPVGGMSILFFAFLAIGVMALIFYLDVSENIKWLVMAAVFGIAFLYIISNATTGLTRRFAPADQPYPKLIVDNSEKKTAPFVDGTGTKAGALLGDVKHDPLQCFFPLTTTYIVNDGVCIPTLMQQIVNKLLAKYPELIERDEQYEGLILPKEENIFVLGQKEGKIVPIRVTCVNRRKHNGNMCRVFSGNSALVVTPEHKIYADEKFVESESLKGTERLTLHDEKIITNENIIKTFSEKDQKSANDYYRFREIKEKNPKFGYKKIAKMLGINAAQTRWWTNGRHKPKAIRTVETLEKIGLLPFTYNNNNLSAISRILGTTFGDGGVFYNLNGIFFSSSEEDSINDYAADMISIFGEGIGTNFDRRISGINNSGMLIRNSNRTVVRFFLALGAPLGKKRENMQIPAWIHLNATAQKEFFGALLGNELCSPKFCDKQKKIQCFCVGLAGDRTLESNRKKILDEIALYLNSYGIITTPSINENEFREGKYVWRLGISTEIENIMRFYKLIPIRYSNEKTDRIRESIEKVRARKKESYENFELRGRSEAYILATLRASKNTLQKIVCEGQIDFEDKEIVYSGMVYNLTTESGNLFANGILASNSGGLGTPPHLRVEAGAIHRANKGVLFIDEIASLKWHWQQELLTAMQEKKYAITGQSEMSSGALVRTEPVPSDFVLVAAGNLPDLQQIHPALRSRIRGAGYEIYVEDSMNDTPENEDRLIQFVAQEVTKDGKIPHFTREAVEEVIEQARRMAGRKKKFTLNLRELGGLVRAAGDVARQQGAKFTEKEHLIEARKVFTSIESQLSGKIIERKREYQMIETTGSERGRVNGLAVIGETSGMVLPIVAEVTPAASKNEGKVIATGKLGTIAKEAVDNVSAIIKKNIGTDISGKDIHIQFLQTYEGVEGDSASISIAVAVLSAMSGIPVKQEYAMTGSLDVRGSVLPVGGVTAKVEAALESGLKKIIVPKANEGDVYLGKKKVDAEILAVKTLAEVLEYTLDDCKEKKELLAKMKKQIK